MKEDRIPPHTFLRPHTTPRFLPPLPPARFRIAVTFLISIHLPLGKSHLSHICVRLLRRFTSSPARLSLRQIKIFN